MPIRSVFFDIGNTLVRNRQWCPGAKQALAAVRQMEVRLGVLSNTGNWDREQLAERLPPDFDWDLFDQDLVLLSSETGIEKPNLSAFLLALQHGGASPWETLFVGENLSETLAAGQAGMMTARLVNVPDDFETIVGWLKS